MSSVALAVSWASSLTSLATTAKPLPASPARAASIVAFRASRFVCSAIEVITFTTLPICAEDSPSFATVAVVVAAALTARDATSLASAAFEAISRIEAPICSAPAATVSTLRETSSAAPATTPDWAEVSSADAEICADDADNSSELAATASAEAAISPTVAAMVWAAVFRAVAICPSSSWGRPLAAALGSRPRRSRRRRGRAHRRRELHDHPTQGAAHVGDRDLQHLLARLQRQ